MATKIADDYAAIAAGVKKLQQQQEMMLKGTIGEPVPAGIVWFAHDGGECPLSDGALVLLKMRCGKVTTDPRTANQVRWIWKNPPSPFDVLEYRELSS